MSGMVPARVVEAFDKMAIKSAQGKEEEEKKKHAAAPTPTPTPLSAEGKEEQKAPAPPRPSAEEPEEEEGAPPTPAAAATRPPAAAITSPTPTTAAQGAARAASITTVAPKTHPTHKMKALVWRGKKNLAVAHDHPVPLVTDRTDAVVRVVKAAICGSDVHLFTSAMPGMKSGDVIGHECMGVVESVGPDVKHVSPGDRVTVSFDLACGQCWFCQNGLFTACDVTNPSAAQQALYGGRTSGAMGYSHLTRGHWGCHAEFVRVPFADTNLLNLDRVTKEVKAQARKHGGGGGAGEILPSNNYEISDDQAALLGDVLPTAWTACELGEVGKGDYVCIFGAGPIGLVTAQCCAHRGARRVVLVDPVEERLLFARRPGVVLRGGGGGGKSPPSSSSSSSSQQCRLDTVHIPGSGTAGIEAALKEIARLSEGEPAGAPDVAVEAVGMHYARGLHHRLQLAVGLETDSAEALNACLRCVRKGGRVSVVGVFAGSANNVLLGAFMEKGLTLRGSQAPVQKYWRDLAGKVARGELDPSRIVTHHFALDDAPKAFHVFDEKADGCVKVILDVGAGAAGGGGGGGGGEAAETVQGVPVVALT